MVKVAPSLLTADFAYIGDTVRMLDQAGADWIHCDVMDNSFVPNMSFGQPMIEALRRITAKTLDVHLMLMNPTEHVEEFARCGADIISVHAEYPCGLHLQRLINTIRRSGKKPGVVLNPATHPDAVEFVYEDINLVLLMSVNPGYGGQKFIPQTLRKIEYVANRIASLGLNAEIEVDGGVNLQNCNSIVSAGASVLVAGHAVVDADDPAAAIAILRGGSGSH